MDTTVDCYMVSDQCQALERDGVFGESESKKKMQVRSPDEDDCVPQIMMEGKTVTVFEPEFFIVSIGHGQPVRKMVFNILKDYDYPMCNSESRPSVSF